jgi:two-component system, sensor histidine kinase and response regulator
MPDQSPVATVLIVDDTPANLSVLLQCLGDAGYHVLIAEDGEEALELMARRAPDLVLLDVMMPGIDGFETCRQLKQNPATADVPVIFMTALADTPEKLAGFAAGAVDYITKPIQHDEALARVATHLTLRRLQGQLADELALKQRFMRIASHDLRNPLCLTRFATAIARRKISDPQTVAAQLDEIDATVAHMEGVIDTFLDLKSAANKQTLNVATLVEAVVRQHQAAAESKQQRLTLATAPDDLSRVDAAATAIYQITANFISNALKFTPPSGEITVGLTQCSARRIRLSVQDSGPGVPIPERPQLFAENGRLSPRPTGGETSHGWGLSIAQQLAHALGGEVGADFPPAGGSLFWCELPAA